MNKILVIVVLLLLSVPMVNAEVPEVNVNYFGEIKTLIGHDYALSYIDWSPDGTKIVSSDWNGGIKIWDTNNWSLLNNLTGIYGSIWRVKWSPDGTKIAGSKDKNVIVWDALTGEELAVYAHNTWVYGLDWSPDGTKILTGSGDNKLNVWDVSTGNVIMNLTNLAGKFVVTIEWSPDGTKIATGSWAGNITIWNASTYEIMGEYEFDQTHHTDVESISWSPDSTRIAAGGDNGNFTIINILENSRLDVENIRETIWTVSWSPDGTKIATSSWAGNLTIWNVNGIIIRKLEPTISEQIDSVAWSPDGTKIASGANDNIIRIWSDLRNVISEQKEIIQKQESTLNNISSDLTYFETDMQSTFQNPEFTLAGSTSDEKVKSLVDVLVQLSRGTKNDLYELLGYD